jgi:hypothetical protein
MNALRGLEGGPSMVKKTTAPLLRQMDTGLTIPKPPPKILEEPTKVVEQAAIPKIEEPVEKTKEEVKDLKPIEAMIPKVVENPKDVIDRETTIKTDPEVINP